LQPTRSDFKAIKAIADGDRTVTDRSTALERTVAHLAVGFLRFVKGEREAGARSYRKCIDMGTNASAKERAERVVMPNMERGLYLPTPCGPIFDTTVTDARDNLAVLEGKTVKETEQRVRAATPLSFGAPSGVAGMTSVGSVGLLSEALRKSLTLRLHVGGSVCDSCAGPGKAATLKRCGRCKNAYYCNPECAKAAWRRGHKKACRAEGQFEVGDWVLLQVTSDQTASISPSSLPVLDRGEVRELRARVLIQGQEQWQVVRLGTAADAPTVTVLASKLKHIRPAA